MIRSVHVKNYKCLRDVEVQLSPLTVLVGANASGKSALVEALRGEFVSGARGVWRRQRGLAFEVRIQREPGDDTTWTWDLNSLSTRQHGVPIDTQFLRLQLEALRSVNKPKAERYLKLQTSGGNLTNLFAALSRQDQTNLVEQLSTLVPQYRDVVARPANEGFLRMEFQDRWQEDLWYLPDEVSDGTILTLAFLFLRYQKPVPELLLIEEPERGLHPFLMEKLVALTRGLSAASFGGSPIQVVMATHSAELLEHLHPEEVRFLRREAGDGSTQIDTAPTESPEWQRAFEEYQYSLGTAWLSGGMGGVPGVA